MLKQQGTERDKDRESSLLELTEKLKALEVAVNVPPFQKVENEEETQTAEVLPYRKDAIDSLRKIMVEASGEIDKEVTKLAVGWKTMQNKTQMDSLLKSFFKPLEVFMNTGFVLSTHGSLCQASKVKVVELTKTVGRYAQELITQLNTIKPTDEKAREKIIQRAGALQEKCKLARILPTSNAGAIKRQILEVAVICKDTHKEFQDLTVEAERVDSVDSKANANVETSVSKELCSDEWYAEMDSFMSSLTVNEVAVIELHVKLLYDVYAALRCIANMTGLSIDGSTSIEQVEYIAWLNNTSAYVKIVQDDISSLGMSLYPPHDEENQEINDNAIKLQRSLLKLGTHVCSWKGERRNGDEICFERIDELLSSVKTYTPNMK